MLFCFQHCILNLQHVWSLVSTVQNVKTNFGNEFPKYKSKSEKKKKVSLVLYVHSPFMYMLIACLC